MPEVTLFVLVPSVYASMSHVGLLWAGLFMEVW